MEIKHYIGSILNMPKNYILINPINGDFIFDELINKEFQLSYESKEYLYEFYKDQRFKSGTALRQITHKHIVYHITLRKNYWENISFDDFKKSLLSVKKQMIEHDEHILCMSRSTCMIEKFEWSDVLNFLNNEFKDTDFTIYVCNY